MIDRTDPGRRMSGEELKPCVCGNEARLIARPGRIPFVECTVCCNEEACDTEAEAIAAWNQRAHPLPEQPQEGLAKLVREYRPTMDKEVLHSWAQDIVAALATETKESGE